MMMSDELFPQNILFYFALQHFRGLPLPSRHISYLLNIKYFSRFRVSENF